MVLAPLLTELMKERDLRADVLARCDLLHTRCRRSTGEGPWSILIGRLWGQARILEWGLEDCVEFVKRRSDGKVLRIQETACLLKLKNKKAISILKFRSKTFKVKLKIQGHYEENFETTLKSLERPTMLLDDLTQYCKKVHFL